MAEAALARVASPAPRDLWDSVLEASAEATIYHTPEWTNACCASAGFEDASRFYETRDGRRIVLPMVCPPGARGIAMCRSMPDGWGLGGAIAPGRLTPDDVSAVLGHLLATTGRLSVKPGPLAADAWSTAPAGDRVRHRLHAADLRHGFGRLWSDFSSGTRNKIRKAEKRGVEVQWGSGRELLAVHWDIYLRWAASRSRRRGMPVWLGLRRARQEESLQRFETVAAWLGEGFRVLVAWIDGVAVASVLVLGHGPFAHHWRSASDREADRSRSANYLLLARLLEDACERGHHYLDLGESGGVRSLEAFKEQFGARPWSHDELLFGPRLLLGAARARNRVLAGANDLALAAFASVRDRRENRPSQR